MLQYYFVDTCTGSCHSFRRFTVKSPLDCEIRSVRQIGGNGIDRSFYHIVIDHQGQYSFTPGQYCGILPPGMRVCQLCKISVQEYRRVPIDVTLRVRILWPPF